MAEEKRDRRESSGDEIPTEPIDRIVSPVLRFMHVEAAGGIVLLVCTLLALLLANSNWNTWFLGLWDMTVDVRIGNFSFADASPLFAGTGHGPTLKHWVNDGLMVIFFFVIGLEVKRELMLGELQDPRRAALPIGAAVGGMLAPAGIYLASVALWPGAPGHSGQVMRGWGIPMATDIAFVVGCMAILGPRVPRSLRVMLLSLAIVDDIGAILVIAVGYTEQIHFIALGFAGLGLLLTYLARVLGIRNFLTYVALGVVVWLGFHESGVHATIAGVILGLMTPVRPYFNETTLVKAFDRASDVLRGDWQGEEHRAAKVQRMQWISREAVSPLEYLETALHPWTSFLIMPLFALVNAGIVLNTDQVGQGPGLAVALGLVVGKPLGIFLAAWLLVRLGAGKLPTGVGWWHVLAGGCLAGIGFTMALFIAELALEGGTLTAAKMGVLAGSAVSAALGMTLLTLLPGRQAEKRAEQEEGGGPSAGEDRPGQGEEGGQRQRQEENPEQQEKR